jgi:cell division protein FtsL
MSEPRWIWAVLLAVTVAAPVSAALFRVWVHQDAVRLGYELSAKEEQRRKVRNELRQLEVELATEKTPSRLSDLARTLGLEPPATLTARVGPKKPASVPAGARRGRP